MKIAIIGAGPTGLVSIKYALDEGHNCDVYEQTGNLGGTWIYTNRVGSDENGLPVHSSMYKGLMTNLPKEVMNFLDFPYPEHLRSYISQPEVLDYFNSYADHFNLRPHIKYFKHVTKVEPLPNKRWAVTAQDSKTQVDESKEYDAVMVCNGHYRDPMVPEIPGQNVFKGFQWHSHNYRTPEPYENKRVLVIGAGPSGRDISILMSKLAEHVFLSHREELIPDVPNNLTQKLGVTKFDENGATFEDGTREDFDIVLYCTGYKYTFPFLTDECGITVEKNWVRSLYKHIINIEHPTMAFVGLPFKICVIPMFDIQARFALAAIAGKFALPSKEDMMKELEDCMRERKAKKIPQRHAHKIGGNIEQREYFEELAKTAGIRNIPEVVNKLYERVRNGRNLNDCFKVVNDDNFIQIA